MYNPVNLATVQTPADHSRSIITHDNPRHCMTDGTARYSRILTRCIFEGEVVLDRCQRSVRRDSSADGKIQRCESKTLNRSIVEKRRARFCIRYVRFIHHDWTSNARSPVILFDLLRVRDSYNKQFTEQRHRATSRERPRRNATNETDIANRFNPRPYASILYASRQSPVAEFDTSTRLKCVERFARRTPTRRYNLTFNNTQLARPISRRTGWFALILCFTPIAHHWTSTLSTFSTLLENVIKRFTRRRQLRRHRDLPTGRNKRNSSCEGRVDPRRVHTLWFYASRRPYTLETLSASRDTDNFTLTRR